LLRRKGIDQQMRRADEPFLHRDRRLDRDEVVHQVLVETATELGQRFGQDKMGLRAVRFDLA
jgi:hypothetical protein